MNQGIRILKLDREMQRVLSQQEIVMQKLTELESWLRSSYEQLTSTPRHHYSKQMCLTTPNPLQQSASTPSHQDPPFFPPAMAVSQLDPLAPVVHRPAVPHSQMLQPKKLINNDKALLSGAIEETLTAANDDIDRYPNLKGSKLPTLAACQASKSSFLWGENNEAVYSTLR